MAAKTYRELLAWQRSMDLVEEVYRITATFPKDEMFALTNQLRRAAVSVPPNIAEGQGRGACDGFAYHLRIAMGSLQELETQLIIARRLGYLAESVLKNVLERADESGKLLRGLLKSLVNQNA